VPHDLPLTQSSDAKKVFCELTIAHQPEIGAPVRPSDKTWISALKKMWVRDDGQHPVLSAKVQDYILAFARPFFERETGVRIDELTPGDLIRFRTQNIPKLKEIMSRTKMVQLESHATHNLSTMVHFFDQQHSEIQKAAASLGMTRDQFLLPGAFVNQREMDGSQIFSFWDLRVSESTTAFRYRTSTLTDQKLFSMDLWIKILAKYGILVVSAFDGTYFHDIFGHTFAALVHPYEELYLQRQFYIKADTMIESQTGLEKKKQIKVYLETGNLLFEAQEIPHQDALVGMTNLHKRAHQKLLQFATDGDPTIIDAEKLIKNRDSLAPEIQQLLAEFKDKIVTPNSGFYGSAEFYGGDFYDVRNHYHPSILIRNFAREGYEFSLEHLRIRALAETTNDGPALLRLFTAYYNASKLKIDYQTIYDGATSGARPLTDSTVQIPWRVGPVEKYWRSYTGPSFQKFLDRLADGFPDPPIN